MWFLITIGCTYLFALVCFFSVRFANLNNNYDNQSNEGLQISMVPREISPSHNTIYNIIYIIGQEKYGWLDQRVQFVVTILYRTISFLNVAYKRTFDNVFSCIGTKQYFSSLNVNIEYIYNMVTEAMLLQYNANVKF